VKISGAVLFFSDGLNRFPGFLRADLPLGPVYRHFAGYGRMLFGKRDDLVARLAASPSEGDILAPNLIGKFAGDSWWSPCHEPYGIALGQKQVEEIFKRTAQSQTEFRAIGTRAFSGLYLWWGE